MQDLNKPKKAGATAIPFGIAVIFFMLDFILVIGGFMIFPKVFKRAGSALAIVGIGAILVLAIVLAYIFFRLGAKFIKKWINGLAAYAMDSSRDEIFADSIEKIMAAKNDFLFLIPVMYEKEENFEGHDFELHYFPGARDKAAAGAKLYLTRKLPDNYKPATGTGQLMHAGLFKNPKDKKVYVPLFVNFESLVDTFGENVHIGIISYPEAEMLSHDCDGILLGPGVFNKII